MRTLILLFIISSLFSFSSPNFNTEIRTQFFSLPNHATSVITDLDGQVEVLYWNQDEIKVEISIKGNSATSDYSMNYMNKKGHFKLSCDYANNMNTLLLRPTKINTTIFRRGQEQKTEQSFKIFIPKRMHYLIK